MADLTSRQQQILGLIVREYVESAEPVGSERLLRRRLGVSSATIRNEMAALEEQGFLTHPHTSAGRIPTEKGYRLFVESLMDEFELPVVEQRTIRHQFFQVALDVDQWMRLAAAVLAHTGQIAALVTSPQSSRSTLKHLQIVAINDQVALLVLVLHGGILKQQMLTLDQTFPQAELESLSNRLNQKMAGRDAAQIRARMSADDFENRVTRAVVEMMHQVDQRAEREVYRDGIPAILRQPEFSAIDRAQALLEILERQYFLEQVLSGLAPTRGVQVIIGGESQQDEMSAYSLVLARYGLPDASGVISLLGPQRMDYPRAIGAVRYVSSLLDDMMARMYG
ncbi:MAG: heat-inducible transcription repressor HrcA [Chloroflexi bacterium]|nr:heat-inducible transcription repressor HrcA [Chloroflexota bacterium]